MSAVEYISADVATLPLTIYYDHSCVVCRSEVDHLAARDHDGALRWVDCSAASFDDSALPIKRDAMKAYIHARDAEGRWLKGAEVFIVAYRAVGFARLSAWMRRFKSIANRLYPLVIAQRAWLLRLGAPRFFNALTRRHLAKRAKAAVLKSAACVDGACAIDGAAQAKH